MKVLVIEDDPSLREIICRSLEKERYVTEEAPDFQTALEKTADYTYDCILLDIMLPDGNGLKLLEMLKEQQKREISSSFRPKIHWRTRSPAWIWVPTTIYPNLSIWPNSLPGSKVLSVEIITPVPLISNTVISGSTRTISRYLLQVPPSN